MPYSNGATSDSIVLRYDANGTLDANFGSSGTGDDPIVGGANDYIKDIAVQADGRIVMGGYASISGVNTFVAARLNSSGSLDTSFNGTHQISDQRRRRPSGWTGFAGRRQDRTGRPEPVWAASTNWRWCA